MRTEPFEKADHEGRELARLAPQMLDLRDASGQVRAVEISVWRRRLSGWEGLARWTEAGSARQAWVAEERLALPGEHGC